MIRVNFSEIGTFEPIPAGVEKLQLVKAEVKESQRSDYPYVNWTFEVKEGEHQGKKIWHTNSLTPGGGPAYYLLRTLTALGVDSNSLVGDVEFPEGYFESLVGAECEAAIIQDSYAGGITNKIRDFILDTPQVSSAPRSPSTPTSGPVKTSRIKIR